MVQDATQAAIRAGYSVKTAIKNASLLLVNVGIQNAISGHSERQLLQKTSVQNLIKPNIQNTQNLNKP